MEAATGKFAVATAEQLGDVGVVAKLCQLNHSDSGLKTARSTHVGLVPFWVAYRVNNLLFLTALFTLLVETVAAWQWLALRAGRYRFSTIQMTAKVITKSKGKRKDKNQIKHNGFIIVSLISDLIKQQL